MYHLTKSNEAVIINYLLITQSLLLNAIYIFGVEGPNPHLYQDKTVYNIGNLVWNTPSVQKAKHTLTKIESSLAHISQDKPSEAKFIHLPEPIVSSNVALLDKKCI
jgi:hypothetical protein